MRFAPLRRATPKVPASSTTLEEAGHGTRLTGQGPPPEGAAPGGVSR